MRAAFVLCLLAFAIVLAITARLTIRASNKLEDLAEYIWEGDR